MYNYYVFIECPHKHLISQSYSLTTTHILIMSSPITMPINSKRIYTTLGQTIPKSIANVDLIAMLCINSMYHEVT